MEPRALPPTAIRALALTAAVAIGDLANSLLRVREAKAHAERKRWTGEYSVNFGLGAGGHRGMFLPPDVVLQMIDVAEVALVKRLAALGVDADGDSPLCAPTHKP